MALITCLTACSSKRRDVNDVTLLVLDHGGHEGLDSPEVGQGVHLEGQLNLGWKGIYTWVMDLKKCNLALDTSEAI